MKSKMYLVAFVVAVLACLLLLSAYAEAENHPFWVEKTWNEERTVWCCGNQPEVLRFRDEDGFVWQMYNADEIRKDFQLGQEYTLRIGDVYFWLVEDERPCPLSSGTNILPELEFPESNWWALP